MAQEQKSGFSFVSAKGTAHYPKLNRPDTKFKEGGEYTCKLFMPEDGKAKIKGDDGKFKTVTVAELEAQLDAEYELAVKAGKRSFKNAGKKPGDIKPMTKPWGWNDPTDDDGNPVERTEEHGPRLFYISAKMTASGVSQRTGEHFEMRPDIFDAGNPAKGIKPKKITEKCPLIGHGSILVISCQAAHFLKGPNAGVTIRLNSAQVIEIKNEGGRDADSQGFDGEEGGYEGEEDTGNSGGKPTANTGRRSVDMDDSDDDDDDSDDDGPSDDGGSIPSLGVQ